MKTKRSRGTGLQSGDTASERDARHSVTSGVRRSVTIGILAVVGLAAAGCADGDLDCCVEPSNVAVSESLQTQSTTLPNTETSTPSSGAAPGAGANDAGTNSAGTNPEGPTVVVLDEANPPTIDALLELGRPLILAHTGGENVYPGETLYGFGESVDAGVDMLDFNVQLTADGELVVFHDDAVDARTDGTGVVNELTYEQISTLDGAYNFSETCGVCDDLDEASYPYRGVRTGDRPPPDGYVADDFAIPTFAGVLDRFPSMPLNVEVKGSGATAKAAVDNLVGQLTESGRLESTVLSSFDEEIVAYAQTVAPDLAVSPGLAALSGWVLERTPLPNGMTIMQVPPVYEGVEVITPELIADSHAAGYVLWVWPNDRALENQDAYLRFLDEGLDGLNINDPAAAVAALEQFEQSGGATAAGDTTPPTPNSTG